MKLRILAVSSKKRKSSQKLKKTEIKTEKQITEDLLNMQECGNVLAFHSQAGLRFSQAVFIKI